MVTVVDSVMREQLLDRRLKLEAARGAFEENGELRYLLAEVDAALERIGKGTYGLCEVCRDPIESERLMADPLVRVCLGDLTPVQRSALEVDLELAAQIQRGLLPKPDFSFKGWEVSYQYEPAGPVSGDYCDLVTTEQGDLYFFLGDVSGKGVAASMLMAHLHAMFRALIPLGLPLDQLVERASRVFCESTLPTHFATLVCGKAGPEGEIEICNAGHLPPLWIGDGGVRKIEATGLPVGVFCNEQFTVERFSVSAGDALMLYTDGLTEALDQTGSEYGSGRLLKIASGRRCSSPRELLDDCLGDLLAFCGRTQRTDDLTIMAVRRNGSD
jgi:sigma-B regulation protein RsbU (phosphoserine phosphatase)